MIVLRAPVLWQLNYFISNFKKMIINFDKSYAMYLGYYFMQ